MSFQIYNTLSAKKEPFEPAEPGHARIYVCGPTVYDYPHLGHARCYVVYDVLVRHLRSTGMQVNYVRNVTDIDDKIINRARERGEVPTDLSERFRIAYSEDMQRLGNIAPDMEPKVSDHLKEIIEMIQTLIDKGVAYESGGDVYFHVPKFGAYGKLSHRKLDDMLAGAGGRTDDDDSTKKKHPFDFALWKGARDGSIAWPSPWGEGRPGWHIECSAMSVRYLGESFDLHGGGLDLVFPHHENELAQAEAATGKPFVRYWMHNGFVQVNKEKMAKSLGNFFTARDVFEKVEPEAIRYAMLTVHYRSPLNLEWEVDDAGNVQSFPLFDDAEKRLSYIYSTRQRLEALPDQRIVDAKDIAARDADVAAELSSFPAQMAEALDDDLNMPVALAKTSEFLRAVNELCDRALAKKGKVSQGAVEAARAGLARLREVLGVGGQAPAAFLARVRDRRAAARGIDGERVAERIAARNQARADKDFTEADAIRDELIHMGVELLDTPQGTDWRLA